MYFKLEPISEEKEEPRKSDKYNPSELIICSILIISAINPKNLVVSLLEYIGKMKSYLIYLFSVTLLKQ